MDTTPSRLGTLLWTPPSDSSTNLTRYADWLRQNRGLSFPDYPALWDWSVNDLEGFWGSLADYFDVRFHQPPVSVLASSTMPGADWFSGATLNYAEHALRENTVDSPEQAVLIFEEETGRREELTRAQLAERVAVVAAKLREVGVEPGDRVAGYFPNTPEALVAFLATASLGAVWTNCPAELSSRGVLDRYAQIEPKVLLAVDAYRYGGKIFDRREIVAEIAAGLPTLQHVVLIENLDGLPPQPLPVPASITLHSWKQWFAGGAVPSLTFHPVPFAHPLWILYSSGTTGAPKAIVQGHGGILFEHLKSLAFHLDLQAGDRFFWFTTSGWMMWNFLISGLLLPGVGVVLFDGSPKHPDFSVLWKFVDRLDVTCFGTSAPFLVACMKEGLRPNDTLAFRSLRSLGSTGAPLPPEAFAWVYDAIKADLLLGSVSGGTDVCTPVVMSHPGQPVRAGEMQCLALGAKVESWDEDGRHAFGRVGELVMTAPLPSMPVFFWNDPDGSRLRGSYYEKFPGVWCHGDWIEIAEPALRAVIHGRSDSTLNRGGVRMGTAEFYSVVEDLPEIAEALVVDTGGLGREDRLLLFLALRPGHELDDTLRQAVNLRLRRDISPRHVPDAIYAVPEIPHTLNGKKLEVPVKRILTGTPVEKAVSREAMANPAAIEWFSTFARGEGGGLSFEDKILKT